MSATNLVQKPHTKYLLWAKLRGKREWEPDLAPILGERVMFLKSEWINEQMNDEWMQYQDW